jgi:hypothetical protein
MGVLGALQQGFGRDFILLRGWVSIAPFVSLFEAIMG